MLLKQLQPLAQAEGGKRTRKVAVEAEAAEALKLQLLKSNRRIIYEL